MQAAHCALYVALKKLTIIPELAIARSHLETAINLSSEYDRVKNSIFWKTSPTQIKRRVRQQAHELAFDCYSHMIIFADEINKYALLQNKLQTKPIKEWRESIFHLQLAFEWIEREHLREIKYKQLSLF